MKNSSLNKLNNGVVPFLLIWCMLSIASISWAVATPLGASPDEPAHIIKAASVSLGELTGTPTKEAAVTRVQVPQSISQASGWPCYAFNPNVSAGCIPETADGTNLVEATTSAGLYNPTYYSLVGWPSLLFGDGTTVVLLMRAVSAILVSFFLALALRSLILLCGSLIGGFIFLSFATPMVFFLNGVVNPNALEIATGASFISSLLLILTGKTSGSRRTLWLIAMTISGILMANTRGISPFWLCCFVLLCIIAVGWKTFFNELKQRDFIVSTLLIALGTAFAGFWILFSGTLTSMGTFPGAGEVTPLRAFFTMVVQRTADPGLIGVFGWLDTFAPPSVYVIWSIFIGGAVLTSFIFTSKKNSIKVLATVAIFIATPAIIQAASVQKSGFIWQGRYSLAIMAGMLIIIAFLFSQNININSTSSSASRFVIIAAVLFVIGQATAFLSVLGRYVTGNNGAIFAALGRGEWNPPLGSLLWFAVNFLAMAALVAGWIITIRMAEDQASKGLPGYQVEAH